MIDLGVGEPPRVGERGQQRAGVQAGDAPPGCRDRWFSEFIASREQMDLEQLSPAARGRFA